MGIDIVLLVLNAALGSLAASGKIPQSAASLTSALGPIIAAAIARLQTGQGKVDDVVTALGALNATLEVLKAQTGLDADTLNQIQVYSNAVQQGMTEYLDSKAGIDLSKLSPVAPII